MKIGELSARTGVAASAIRFYERCGLLPVPGRAVNGYRTYSEDAIARLRIVSLSLSFGLTVEQLRIAFDAGGGLAKPEMLALLTMRLSDMDELIRALKKQRTQLSEVLMTLSSNWSRGTCVDPTTLAGPAVRPGSRSSR